MNEPKRILPQTAQAGVMETHVVHHNGLYMATHKRNGYTIAGPKIISAEQARSLVEAGEQDPHTTTSRRFNSVTIPGQGTWSWIGTQRKGGLS